MIMFMAFLLGLGLVAWRTWPYWRDRNGEPVLPAVLASIVGGVVLGSLLAGLAGGVQIVGAGERVVVFDNIRGVRPVPLKEGLNFIVPFIQIPATFDCRVKKVEFDATAASKDLQDVTTKVALNYHPDAEQVAMLYQHYGVGYEEKVIHPAVQEAVKAVTALYTAEELITKRDTVKAQVQEHLSKMMQTAGLILKETYITDFKFSQSFAHAIEEKQVAEQQALKARRDLERVKLESEQKIAQLRAEAEGLRMQKEQITPQLVRLRMIEKWDGHYPLIMGSGSMPILKIDDLKAAAGREAADAKE